MELKKLDLSQQLSLIREESERQESVSEMDSPTGEMDSSKGEMDSSKGKMDSSALARGNRKTKEAGGEDKRQKGFDQASVLATLVGLSTEIVSPSSPNTEKRRRFVIISNVVYIKLCPFLYRSINYIKRVCSHGLIDHYWGISCSTVIWFKFNPLLIVLQTCLA
jgi:hypothetical protein